MSDAYIIGWGHTPFGKLDNLDLEQLIRDAVQPALASAGLEPKDIDGIFVGHFNAGFVRPGLQRRRCRRWRSPSSGTRRRCAPRTPAPPARQRSGRRSTRWQPAA